MCVHICICTASEKMVSVGLIEKLTREKPSGGDKGDNCTTSGEEDSRQRPKPRADGHIPESLRRPAWLV